MAKRSTTPVIASAVMITSGSDNTLLLYKGMFCYFLYYFSGVYGTTERNFLHIDQRSADSKELDGFSEGRGTTSNTLCAV